MLITDSKGRTVSLYDEVLTDDIRAIDAEAARREGRAPVTNGLFTVDLRAHPDLADRRERAFDEAAARQRDRPPLLVKPGDWVRINGYRFLVASIQPEARVITTKRYDADGCLVSSVPCLGDGLVPDTSDAPDPDDLHPPDSMRSGHDRARFVLRAHKEALGKRAL